MANNVVFDSSVLIMLFAKEPGYETVRQNMKHAIISTINIAEVYKYCIAVQNLSEDDCVNSGRKMIQIFNMCRLKIDTVS